jgi:predicted transcriptional regulator
MTIYLEVTGLADDVQWYSNIQPLTIIVQDSASPILEEITIISLLFAIIFTFFVSFFTESGKYRMFSLISLIIPLFTRIKKDEVLENFVRGQIYGFIKTNPGCHYTKIKKKLGIGNGTLAHHLNILEKTGMIKSRTEGVRYRLFYPTEMKFPKKKRYMLSDLQLSILNMIRNNEGITQKDIVSTLQARQQTISYNIKELEKVREILSIRKNGRKYYYIPLDKK